ASDNLNDDGIVNPGENIRYVFSLKNNSAINFSNLTVRANPNYDGHWLTIPTFNAGATQSFSYSAVDPSTYLSFTVPKYYTDSTINVFLRITDESNNLWLDTLTFDVKPFSHQLYFSPVARLSGISTMTLSISIVDSSQVKNHLYVVTGVDSLPLTGKPGYTLKDSTTNTILLANHPLPDQLGHISPIVDGFKVLLANYDTLKGMANWSMSGVRHWTWANGNFGMEGFGGAIGNGYDNYFSGSTVGYDKLRDVEVRFATTDTAGNILNSNDANASFAYRYLRKANSPPAQPSFSSFIIKTGVGYVFQDYNKSMPIAVYDINTNPPRRLMIGYLENNVINGLVDGKYWPPYYADPVYGDNLGTSGPREWFFIFDKNYSTTPDATLETDILDNTLPIMWFGTVTRRDQNGWSSADTFRIIAHHPITSNDKWTFTPSVMVLTGVKQQPIPSSFSLSQNYPNPFNPSTTIRYELPAISKVTIRIYNVLGQEVRTLVNQVQTAGQQVAIWDSRNSAGVTVSTGVYFYRIEASPISGKGNSFSDVKKMLLLK
ncbi:MAG: T9SS type A sorting domain-containing protein, partial [Bacteroidota bacterium]|nr:T9SS type A sorting domain-containing protein [Bacteroidota bacterium]